MLRRIIIAGAAMLLALPAFGLEVGGIKLDDRATVDGAALVINGAGIRTKLMFKVYVASLYVPAKVSTAAAAYATAPRRVQLNMVRDVGADQMMEALSDGLKQANPAPDFAALKMQIDQLATIMKGVGPLKVGNVLRFDFVGNTTQVSLDGAAKGSIAGSAFNKALMNAWIGDSPVQADLRKAMLGG